MKNSAEIWRENGGVTMSHIKITDVFDAPLLPCPLCGAAPARNAQEAIGGGVFLQETIVPEPERDYFHPGYEYTVRCRGCFVRISRAKRDAVIAAWNRRTNV